LLLSSCTGKASSADGEAAAADSDGVEQQQAEEVVVKQSKKDKKAKRKAEEASEQQQPAEEAVAAEDTKPSKKAKKEGKAVNGHAANGAAAATNGHAQDVDQQSNGAGKKSKKEKRKAAEEDNAEEEEQPKQSNKKSSGSKQASGSIDLTAHASVGNAELARKGKTIVKALYKEHPEVAAMGADKVRYTPPECLQLCLAKAAAGGARVLGYHEHHEPGGWKCTVQACSCTASLQQQHWWRGMQAVAVSYSSQVSSLLQKHSDTDLGCFSFFLVHRCRPYVSRRRPQSRAKAQSHPPPSSHSSSLSTPASHPTCCTPPESSPPPHPSRASAGRSC
jgi:chemotaxis protein histidine kinase CheA